MNYRIGFMGLILVFIASVVFAAPWDFLRYPAGLIIDADAIVSWILLFISLGMFAIALLALRKKHSEKLSWVTAAFGLFFVKALLIVLDIYFSPGQFFNSALQAFFDMLIIGSLFVGIFRK